MPTSSEPADKHSSPAPRQPGNAAERPPNWWERFGPWAGRFFSSLGHLLGTLAIYAVLAVVTFLLLYFKLRPDYQMAGFIAYEIATGGDPFNFKDVVGVGDDRLVWTWLLIFHLAAWVIVPVLIGTAADAAFRAYEKQQARAERRLRRIIKKEARKRFQLTDDEADDFADKTLDGFRQPGARSKRQLE